MPSWGIRLSSAVVGQKLTNNKSVCAVNMSAWYTVHAENDNHPKLETMWQMSPLWHCLYHQSQDKKFPGNVFYSWTPGSYTQMKCTEVICFIWQKICITEIHTASLVNLVQSNKARSAYDWIVKAWKQFILLCTLISPSVSTCRDCLALSTAQSSPNACVQGATTRQIQVHILAAFKAELQAQKNFHLNIFLNSY